MLFLRETLKLAARYGVIAGVGGGLGFAYAALRPISTPTLVALVAATLCLSEAVWRTIGTRSLSAQTGQWLLPGRPLLPAAAAAATLTIIVPTSPAVVGAPVVVGCEPPAPSATNVQFVRLR
jgi:hypothetical protein